VETAFNVTWIALGGVLNSTCSYLQLHYIILRYNVSGTLLVV